MDYYISRFRALIVSEFLYGADFTAPLVAYAPKNFIRVQSAWKNNKKILAIAQIIEAVAVYVLLFIPTLIGCGLKICNYHVLEGYNVKIAKKFTSVFMNEIRGKGWKKPLHITVGGRSLPFLDKDNIKKEAEQEAKHVLDYMRYATKFFQRVSFELLPTTVKGYKGQTLQEVTTMRVTATSKRLEIEEELVLN